MKVLFVCTSNRLRSPTAQAVFAGHPGLEVRSAGMDSTSPGPLTAELVLWADLIFVMETGHREKIRKKFKKRPSDANIVNLGIPDEYDRDQPELIELLERRAGPRLKRALVAGDE